MSHTIIHFELPADDVDRMKAFYGNVFGWKFVGVKIGRASCRERV
jgi:predicted enzyme related to lactoylglutathione lyase